MPCKKNSSRDGVVPALYRFNHLSEFTDGAKRHVKRETRRASRRNDKLVIREQISMALSSDDLVREIEACSESYYDPIWPIDEEYGFLDGYDRFHHEIPTDHFDDYDYDDYGCGWDAGGYYDWEFSPYLHKFEHSPAKCCVCWDHFFEDKEKLDREREYYDSLDGCYLSDCEIEVYESSESEEIWGYFTEKEHLPEFHRMGQRLKRRTYKRIATVSQDSFQCILCGVRGNPAYCKDCTALYEREMERIRIEFLSHA